ncbi:MAG: hypothetical protein HY852_02685 [Bradyrhizobium sp.]|uniref:hypothetical protein n=1 Tax=Bradyrhizobium sp. TaxID=376 RepID=UPI0025C53DC9|nr:hypothetical protein [Bradyrhizobium sp.]MBI5260709.1 hypothetical protein [Bradyrhizobium sp.]
MQHYIAHANIDHYLDLLRERSLPAEGRATVFKMLIAEEDKLGHDLEQLEFAESRAKKGRFSLDRIRRIHDDAQDPLDRLRSERLLAAAEEAQLLLEHFCRLVRRSVNSNGL